MRKVHLFKSTVYLMYAALALSLGSLAREAPLMPFIITATLFTASLLFEIRGHFPIHLKTPVVLILLFVGIATQLMGITVDLVFIRITGIVLFAVCAKLIVPKAPRDLLQMFVLNLVVLAVAATIRWGIEFTVIILLEAFLSILGLLFISGAKKRDEISLQESLLLLRTAAYMTLLIIPITIVVFVILPRPLVGFWDVSWGVNERSGFSDKVSAGDVSQIQLNSAPAFRAKWVRGTRQAIPYWRGIVLDRYHDGTWEKTYHYTVKLPRVKAPSVEYEIVLEPMLSQYIFSLGVPYFIGGKRIRTKLVPGLTFESLVPITKRMRYQIQAFTPDFIPVAFPPDSFLAIEPSLKDSLQPIAGELRGQTDLQTAQFISRFLKTTCTYSLTPGQSDREPVLWFLNDKRQGHCEHFASAMALLARSLDIPARVIGGYMGGEWNEMGGYYIVRQSDAHAWVEIFTKRHGWIRFDPTPEGAPRPKKSQFAAALFRSLDFLRLRWYYWVLDYDLSRQIELAQKTNDTFNKIRRGRLFLKPPSRRTLILVITPILIIAALLWTVVYLRRLYSQRPKSVGEQFVRIAAHRGFEKKTGQTIRELTETIKEREPRYSDIVDRFTETYYAWEYGAADQKEACLEALEAFKQSEKKVQ